MSSCPGRAPGQRTPPSGRPRAGRWPRPAAAGRCPDGAYPPPAPPRPKRGRPPISDTDTATDAPAPAPATRRERLAAHRGALAGGPAILVGLVVWNVASYVFFLAAARILGPDDYGLVAALLAATVVVSVPCNALAWGVARVVAAPPGGAPPRASAIYHRAWRRSMWLTPAILAVVALAMVGVWAVDRDAPLGPMLVTLLVIGPMAPLFLSMGHLQGERRYRAYSASFSLMNLPRPVVLPILAAAGLGV
jgi:hypothetical protein